MELGWEEVFGIELSKDAINKANSSIEELISLENNEGLTNTSDLRTFQSRIDIVKNNLDKDWSFYNLSANPSITFEDIKNSNLNSIGSPVPTLMRAIYFCCSILLMRLSRFYMCARGNPVDLKMGRF